MRIVFMIDHMKGFGGAQRVIANLANEAINRNNEVLLLLTGNKKDSVYELNPNIEIYCVDNACGKLDKIKKMRKKLISFCPTVVISFLTMVNVLAVLLTIGTNIPIIISERNDPEYETTKEKILSYLFYRFSTLVVVQTKEIADKIKKYYKKQIRIIANPLIKHNVEKKNYIANEKIIAVGRLNKQKNYYLMIKAFADFYKEFNTHILEIYGAGTLEDDLQKFIDSLNLSDAVFLRGNSTNILQLEELSDIFLMTSDFEGMPNALAEAMSVGLPCIATNCDGGGAEYLIKNRKNGLLVKKGEKEEIVSALKELARDTKMREFIGNNAKKVNIDLSIDSIMKQWFCAIDDIVK